MICASILLVAFDCPAEERTRVAAGYTPDRSVYAFVSSDDPLERLDETFPPPAGFVRSEAPEFGAWLRGLPILRDRVEVRAYDGRVLRSPSAAIVPIDVGNADLQQCADSAIRLHAEFLWASGRADSLAYHFTSGDRVAFADWVSGERLLVTGATVKRARGPRRADDHASMRSWLELVFRYAGTRSLHRDSVAVEPGDVQPGDFFVAPGSPGHAVVVLDVAAHEDGRRVALLGQGFMPAQEFHVLRARGDHVIDGVWFVLPRAGGQLNTPSWRPFDATDARRFVR